MPLPFICCTTTISTCTTGYSKKMLQPHANRKPARGGGGGKGVRGYDAAIDPVLGCACRVCAAAAVGISIE